MKYLLYLSLSMSLVACSPKVSENAQNNSSVAADPQPLSPSSTTKSDPKIEINNPKTFVVSGKVMYTRNYCGGAAPSPELQMEYNLPRPFFGQELIVRTGETNTENARILARTSVKEDGTFSFSLPPGDYCIVIAQKEHADALPSDGEYITVDADCYRKWAHSCDASFKLRDRDVKDINLIFHEQCFTRSLNNCVQWHGPLPPSAPRGDHN